MKQYLRWNFLLFENYGQEVGGGNTLLIPLNPKAGEPVSPVPTVVAPMPQTVIKEKTTTDSDLSILEGVMTNAVVCRGDPRYEDGRRSCIEQLDIVRTLIGGRWHRSTGTVPGLFCIVG